MTTAAKKAAATKADQALTTPVKKAAAKPVKIDLAEEQRTANLIAVLGLGEAAWSDLYAAGVDAEDGPVAVAREVAVRLGLVEA